MKICHKCGRINPPHFNGLQVSVNGPDKVICADCAYEMAERARNRRASHVFDCAGYIKAWQTTHPSKEMTWRDWTPSKRVSFEQAEGRARHRNSPSPKQSLVLAWFRWIKLTWRFK